MIRGFRQSNGTQNQTYFLGPEMPEMAWSERSILKANFRRILFARNNMAQVRRGLWEFPNLSRSRGLSKRTIIDKLQ